MPKKRKSSGAKEESKRRPIRLSFTSESRDGVRAVVLVLHRWLREERATIAVPHAFYEAVRSFALVPDILDLDLENHFHLRKQTQHDSSAAVLIYEYNARDESTLGIKYVKSSTTDSYTLNVKTGRMNCNEQHYMSYPTKYVSTYYPSASVDDARTLLLEHWVTPRKWLQQERAVVVRPSDLLERMYESANDIIPKANGVALCPCAVTYLSQGFTLLLVVGDLVRVELPGRFQQMLFAGIMWKEEDHQRQNETENTVREAGGSSTVGRRRVLPSPRPDELAFILAEKASRSKNRRVWSDFTGRVSESSPTHTFLDRMYQWEMHDVFKYYYGKWRD